MLEVLLQQFLCCHKSDEPRTFVLSGLVELKNFNFDV